MQASSQTSSTSGWLQGWALTGVTALVLIPVALLILAFGRFDAAAFERIIRLTARISLILFCLAFTAAGALRLWPSSWTRWQRRNRRYLGVSFAVSHAVHAAAIIGLVRLYPADFHEVHRGSNLPGEVGYLVLALLTATSFDRVYQAMDPKAWKALHTVGSYFLWIIFLIAEISRLRQGSVHAFFAAVLIGALGIRFGSRLLRPAPAAEGQPA
jgi:sulfoxide reductase heme-binding subunit YedZ